MTILKTYSANFLVNLHRKVKREKGKFPAKCSKCGKPGKFVGRIKKMWSIHWANVSGKYTSSKDFRALCRSCHTKYDIKIGHRKNPPSWKGRKLSKEHKAKSLLGANKTRAIKRKLGIVVRWKHKKLTIKKMSMMKKKWWANRKVV